MLIFNKKLDYSQNMVTTPDQRAQWNGFLNNLQGQSISDQSINDYKAANPAFSITSQMIPQIQQEHAAIRTGDSFGSLNADQLAKVRTGMSDSFLNQTDLSKQMYPQFKVGSTDMGTNMEAYAGGGGGKNPPNAIPLPDYNNPSSRLKYAQNWTTKYGPLMQGRGDTPLRVNETADTASDTSKNLATKFATKLGLDPALLYSSAMEEGMSGLFPDKKGQVDDSGDKKFPVSGYTSFGLDTFSDKFKDLVKKGYLPADFNKNFSKSVETNEKSAKVNSANFKDVDSALQAKAAMIKDSQDETEQYAKDNNIKLSDKAKEFFTLVHFNAGEGNMHKMLMEYNRNGYLKDDSFIDKRPSDFWKQPYENVSRRLKMRDALKLEGLF